MHLTSIVNQHVEATFVPRNAAGDLTTFDVLNKTQRQQLKSLLNGAIKNCGLPAPYYTANRNKHLEGVKVNILDVHLADDRVDALIVRANAYVVNPSTCRTRNEKKFFLATRKDTVIEVRELPKGSCTKRAKTTIGLGLLTGHYMKQATQAATPVKGFSILLEDGQLSGKGHYPLQPAVATQKIMELAVRIWQITGQRE